MPAVATASSPEEKIRNRTAGAVIEPRLDARHAIERTDVIEI